MENPGIRPGTRVARTADHLHQLAIRIGYSTILTSLRNQTPSTFKIEKHRQDRAALRLVNSNPSETRGALKQAEEEALGLLLEVVEQLKIS